MELDVPSETTTALVPNLILQPLVENAIRHGIERRAGPGKIDLVARHQGDRLVIQIKDNGAGLAEPFEEGIGLSNARARLRELYGAEQRLDLLDRSSGGLNVTLELPFHQSTDVVIGEVERPPAESSTTEQPAPKGSVWGK